MYRGKIYTTVPANAVEELLQLERQRMISSFSIHSAAVLTFALLVAGLGILVICARPALTLDSKSLWTASPLASEFCSRLWV